MPGYVVTIKIPLPDVDDQIRQAVFLLSDDPKTSPDKIKKIAIGYLLKWAEDHETHPKLPTYANRSYLPKPIETKDKEWSAIERELTRFGIKVVSEFHPFLTDSEECLETIR